MKSQKDASTKAMDYLAIRDHSKSELKNKLSRCGYEAEEIENALNYVEERGWLLPPEELAAKVALQLHRKKKSHFYILQYLKQKQLPAVDKDPDLELEKATDLVTSRFPTLSNVSYEDKKQIARLLKNRGFDGETISRVLSY